MKNAFIYFGVGLIAAFHFPCLSASAGVIIHDQSFLSGTWSVSILGGTNVSSASLTRLAGGGVTGDAQRTNISGSGSYTFDVQQFKTDRDWTPILDGEITSLSWEFWFRVTGASDFAGFRLAARQGGSTYIANVTYLEPPIFSSNWQRAAGSILPDAFSKASGGGPATLEFLETSPSIQFGYMLSRGVFRAGATSPQVSFYDLNIESKPVVPEPSTTILFAVGLMPFLMRLKCWRKC